MGDGIKTRLPFEILTTLTKKRLLQNKSHIYSLLEGKRKHFWGTFLKLVTKSNKENSDTELLSRLIQVYYLESELQQVQ